MRCFPGPLSPLCPFCAVYFVQGIMELATLAQTYHLKDTLHADPAQVRGSSREHPAQATALLCSLHSTPRSPCPLTQRSPVLSLSLSGSAKRTSGQYHVGA